LITRIVDVENVPNVVSPPVAIERRCIVSAERSYQCFDFSSGKFLFIGSAAGGKK
jgi:hypothetical protein